MIASYNSKSHSRSGILVHNEFRSCIHYHRSSVNISSFFHYQIIWIKDFNIAIQG